jgi:hypothetical protein
LYCSKRECRTGWSEPLGAESEVACLYPTDYWSGRSTKVRPFLHINKFIFVGIIPYLRDMKTYLKTPTSELTVRQIRSIVCETIKWCETNVGTKSQPVKYSVRTRGVKSIPACGVYDYNSRTIMVFRNYSPTVKCVVRAVLHEYAHYLQNLRWYNNVLSKVGYNKHPQELEARGMENLYSVCWNDIKQKL